MATVYLFERCAKLFGICKLLLTFYLFLFYNNNVTNQFYQKNYFLELDKKNKTNF